MSKQNKLTTKPIEEEALHDQPVAEDTDLEDEMEEFDGPINTIELENDEYDDTYADLNFAEMPMVTSKTEEAVQASTELTCPAGTVIPSSFLCPLTKQLIREPVRIAGSKFPIAYEKKALETHYEEYGTDPQTNEYLDDDVHFMPDLALKRQIADFCLSAHQAAKGQIKTKQGA